MAQDLIAQMQGLDPAQLLKLLQGLLSGAPGTGGTMGRTMGNAGTAIGNMQRTYPEGPDLTGQQGTGGFEDMLGGLDFTGGPQTQAQGNLEPAAGNSQSEADPFAGMLDDTMGRRDKARQDYLSTFDEKSPEVPDNVQPAFRTADLGNIALPAALIALFGGSKAAGQFLEGALGGKIKKAETDTQLRRERFNQQQQEAATKQKRAAAVLGFAESDTATALDMSETARKERLAEDKQRQIDGRSLRSQWLATNQPAEVATIARILREQFPEYAPTIEEEKRQVESLSLPEAKLFNDNLRRFRESSYFESDTQMESAMAEYAKNRGQLIAAGVPERLLDPIPDTKSIKQVRAENAKIQQDKMYLLAKDKFKFDKEFKLKGRDWEKAKFERSMGYKWQTRADSLAKTWAQLEIARANYGLARDRGDIARMRMFLDQENKASSLVAKQMSERVDELQRLSNHRHAELLRSKWKPEKIASDPIIKELNDRITQYLTEAELNEIEVVPQIKPSMTDEPQAGPGWQYTPGSFQDQVPGSSPNLARIDALKGVFLGTFPGGRAEQFSGQPRMIQGTNTPSLHNTGNALDLYHQNLPQVADWAIRQPGVQTVIFNRRIWSPSGGWRPYDKDPHTDHVHVDYGRNSAATPNPNPPSQSQAKPPASTSRTATQGYGVQNQGRGGSESKSSAGAVVDIWGNFTSKYERARRLRKIAMEKLKYVGPKGERYSPADIRKIYEKETGLKADF